MQCIKCGLENDNWVEICARCCNPLSLSPKSSNIDIQSILSVGTQLRKASSKGDLVIFAGAGISVEPPTCSPLWKDIQYEFMDLISEMFMKEDWPSKDHIKPDCVSILKDLRPETFLQSIATYCSFFDYYDLLNILTPSNPNLNHLQLASLLHSGRIKTILTTNFDEHIESAINIITSREPRICCAQKAFENAIKDIDNAKSKIDIFKLHGTISLKESISATLSQTAILPEAKRDFITNIIKHHPILFIGYSGYDDDIFPVLKDLIKETKMPVFICIHPGSDPCESINTIAEGNIFKFSAILDKVFNVINPGNLSSIITKASFRINETIVNEQRNRLREFCNSLIKNISLWKLSCILGYIALSNGHNLIAAYFGALAADIIDDRRYPISKDQKIFGKINAHILEMLAQLNIGSIVLPQTAYLSEVQLAWAAMMYPELRATIDLLYVRDFVRKESVNSLAKSYLESANMLLEDIPRGIIRSKLEQDFWWTQALLFLKNQEEEKAMNSIKIALENSKLSNDPLSYARLCCDAAEIFIKVDDYEAANELIETAGKLAERIRDNFVLARSYSCKVILLRKCGQFDIARRYVAEAEKFVKLLKEAGSWGVVDTGFSTGYICPLCGHKNETKATIRMCTMCQIAV